MKKPVAIVTYSPIYRESFYSINKEWLDEFFFMTPADEEIIRHPERIVEEGGEVFFALLDNQPIGTCALFKTGNDEMELAKMGVLLSGRRKGTGSLLLLAALDFAREKKMHKVVLETSYRLPHAIALYEKFGFQKVGEEYIHPLFGRRIFKMVLEV